MPILWAMTAAGVALILGIGFGYYLRYLHAISKKSSIELDIKARTLEAEQKARRVFWRDRRDLARQLERWNAAKLERLVRRLAAAHRALLANNQAAELLLAQELADIARFATARR